MTTARPTGRSSLARLPRRLRDAVDTAIAAGDAIDAIQARIRAGGHACARFAVARYARRMRAHICEQHGEGDERRDRHAAEPGRHGPP
ncbi:MAG: hypothetical protein OXO52_11995 [Rhodospirillales bacterium]|nr:hypothetical protein [Rhodospirillales bacterium]MDE0379109.1 hypothetical protein [Rhodospirillales bacterium]